MAVSMKFRVFWDALPCSQVDVNQLFRGMYCLHHQGDEIQYTVKAVRTPETSVNFNVTTRRYILEHCRLHDV
jgi:hypothetical protein